MIVLGVHVGRHMAPVIRQHTGQMLELNSGVMDAEGAEDLIYALQNTVAGGRRHIFDEHV